MPGIDLRILGEGVDLPPDRIFEDAEIPAGQVVAPDPAREKSVPAETGRLAGKVKEDVARSMARHVTDFDRLPGQIEGTPLLHPVIDPDRFEGNAGDEERSHDRRILEKLPVVRMPVERDPRRLEPMGVGGVVPVAVRQQKSPEGGTGPPENLADGLESAHRSVDQNRIRTVGEKKGVGLEGTKRKNTDFHEKPLSGPNSAGEDEMPREGAREGPRGSRYFHLVKTDFRRQLRRGKSDSTRTSRNRQRTRAHRQTDSMKHLPLPGLLALLLAAPLFADGPKLDAWSVTVKGGPAFPIIGQFTGGTAELPTTTMDDEGEPVTTGDTVNLGGLDWSDAFDDFATLAVELDFWESPTRSLYFGLSHTRASGKSVLLGSFDNRPVNASFSDYSDTALYAGVRWGLGHTDWIKSLVSVQLGAAVVDELDATVTNLPAFDRIGLYKQTTVFSAGIFVSVSITPLDFLEVGIDSGFIYQTAPKENSAETELLGLQDLNSEGDLGIVPVRIMATIKF